MRSTTTSPGVTPACFEPTIDYVVVKWPRFAFEKFPGSDPTLSTHMRSVGEAMAIGRTFKQAFAKALRSRELDKHPARGRARRRGAAGGGRHARPGALRAAARAAAPRRRARARARRHEDRPLVPARAARAGTRPGLGLRRASARSARWTPARRSSRPAPPTTTPAGSAARPTRSSAASASRS